MIHETERDVDARRADAAHDWSCPSSDSRASGPRGLPERCTRLRRDLFWRRLRWKIPRCLPLPLLVLVLVALLFVGWDRLEAYWFVTESGQISSWGLAARIGVFSTVLSGLIMALVCRDRRTLSRSAEQLAGVLEAYINDPASEEWFENSGLLHCTDVLDCEHTQCPMHDARGKRCWQEMALDAATGDSRFPRMAIARCHTCEVYRLSCGDSLTELGEGINNLLFVLRAEGKNASRMQAQMVEREKMFSIGQLASGIAHEVGNPLSSISSIVQVLKRAGMNGETGDQLDLIQTHIQRISKTVHQLSNLARRKDEHWAMIDVDQTLEATVRLISFDRRARNVDIRLEPAAPGLRIRGIVGQLEQVFLNLSLNALDAMPDGGTLLIDASRNRGSILVRFEDSGHGIAPEVGRRMFDPFFSTKDPGSGTGLGLAVSFSIIQKLNGSLEYDSSVGEGTTFRVRLPIPEGSIEMES